MNTITATLVVLFIAQIAKAQVNPIIPNNVPKKPALPVPEIKTIKPDLTIEIENATTAYYNATTKKTTFKVTILVSNNSDAAAASCKVAPSVYHHSSTNIDHVFWHIGDLIDIPSIAARGNLRRTLTLQMDEMPVRTTSYPLKMIVDKSYIIDEGNEHNNESNKTEILVSKT